MMNVKNAVYKEITPDWGKITLPLKEGTPMSLVGKIVNGAGAAGLVPQTVSVKPVTPSINLLVGGSVSLAEVNAAYGSALTDAAKESMNGIAFYGEDGTPEPNPIWTGQTIPGTLPSVTAADNGKALVVDNGAWDAQAIATLPAVTASDNGKSLIVDAGAWTVGSGGGGGTGGGVLVVNEVEDGENIRLSETWQTIHDALADGEIVSIPYLDGASVTSQIVEVAKVKVIDNGSVCGIWIFGADLMGTPSYSCSLPTDYPSLGE